MTEHAMTENGHVDLAGYLLDTLDAPARERFARHLASCSDCRSAAAELGPVADYAGSLPPRVELPADLRRRTLSAVEHAAACRSRARRPARANWLAPRRLRLLGAATLVAAAFAVGLWAAGDRGPSHPSIAGPGDHRGLDGDRLPIRLAARGGGPPHAHALLRRGVHGAVITFHSDHLPGAPAGHGYELWLVGPGDAPGRPNRVSAGSFLPDAKGTTFVDLAASTAKRFPVIAITLEPTDGDPAPTPPDIVRSDWSAR